MKVISMKKFRKILLSTSIILLLLVSIGTIYAKDGSSNVTVSYTPSKVYSWVKLEVHISGKGTVFDQYQSIQEGSLLYDLQEKDTKEFKIIPAEGYELSKLEFNNGYQTLDLLKNMQGDMVNITVEDRNASLFIHFKKKTSEGLQGNMNGLPTGDETNILKSIFTLVSMFVLLLLLYRNTTKEE